ncbi:MAG TPA: ATP-binding protein [Vicinamibacterales bacterium]|nr:ATP-binding protein [Vicinamibacterales bacterium]
MGSSRPARDARAPDRQTPAMAALPHLTLGLAGVVAYAIVSLALRDYPYALAVFGNAVLLASSLLVVGVIVRRRHAWAGCQRLFWDTLAIGMALWAVGHAGFAFDDLVVRSRTWLSWHTLFSLCGGIAPVIALLTLPHRGPRTGSVTIASLDLTASGLLAVFLYSYFVLVPSLSQEARPAALNTLLQMVQLNRLLLLLALVVLLWLARSTSWSATYRRLAVAVGVGLVLRLGTNVAIARGEYQSGTLHDLAWIVPWLGYAWAALEAPASRRDDVDSPADVSPIWLTAIPVLLIPALGYGLLQLGTMGSTIDSFRVLLTSVTTVCGLALLTLRLAAQSGELHRVDARLKLLAAATEQTGDLILITRADGGFEHANAAFLQALGYSRRDLSQFGFSDLLAPGSEDLKSRITAAVRDHGVWRGTLMRRRKDGTSFPAASTVVALRDQTGSMTHLVTVDRDVSEELRLRDQIVHSERMSAIGELVAGVAHEINNPLQAIIGCVELMMDDTSGKVERQDLELVRREAARAGQIVRNLLSFIRRGQSHRELADLNQLVRATTQLREYHLQQCNIGLVLHFAPGDLPVIVNRDEIQQVILNLLLNAEQALASSSSRGTIVVETTREDGRHIVEVSDTGPGISPDLRGRIFEPFFTTKEVGQGTGLGLSISHGLALAHGGALELRESGSGARFRLALPAARHDEVPASPGTARAAADAARRVLIVDDESSIRRLLGKLLERRGFEVVEADTAEAALSLPNPERLDLLVCDLRLPGIGGAGLYRRLAEKGPVLRTHCLFISGESSPAERHDPDLSHVPFLAKPFTAADLDGVLSALGLASSASAR